MNVSLNMTGMRLHLLLQHHCTVARSSSWSGPSAGPQPCWGMTASCWRPHAQKKKTAGPPPLLSRELVAAEPRAIISTGCFHVKGGGRALRRKNCAAGGSLLQCQKSKQRRHNPPPRKKRTKLQFLTKKHTSSDFLISLKAFHRARLKHFSN